MTKQKELEHWAAEGRPQSCPACGSPRLARILYGLPAFSKDLEEALEGGTVTLGGCVITGDDPEWECLECGQKIDASAKRGGPGAEA
jgi:ribosomal protein L37AE/L43A